MKLGVIGSRKFKPRRIVWEWLYIIALQKDIEAIVSGGAVGPDTWGAMWGRTNNICVIEHIPAWYVDGEYDETAGFARNALIVEDSDVILAFYDGKSSGTRDTMNQAKTAGKKVYFVSSDGTLEAWV